MRDESDSLRSVPPREFVRARTALAAELEKKGHTAEARRIRRLKRPSPVVWALNAAAARSRAFDELAEAVDRLRRAQLGQGELRPAIERYRAALEPVIRTASERLREAGTRMTTPLERRLQATLLAAITDRRRRAELAAGRLTEEYAEPGFEVLTSGPGPTEPPRARPRAPAPTRPTEAERRRLEAERKALRAAARQAQRRMRALDTAARRKEQAAAAADRKVEALRAALREHERQAQVLRTAANEARAAHRSAVERASSRPL